MVCIAASHYCSMLETEGVAELLKSLSAHADAHVKGLADSILRMLDERHGRSQTSSRQPGSPNS